MVKSLDVPRAPFLVKVALSEDNERGLERCRGFAEGRLVNQAVRACISLGLVALAVLLTPRAGWADDPPPAKSTPAAVRQFRECLAFQDRGVYDLAADE